MLHASYAIRFNLTSILRTARTQYAPSVWARIAARLEHVVSGAYNSHSPLNFHFLFASFGCLNVQAKNVGYAANSGHGGFSMPSLPSHDPCETRDNLDGIDGCTATPPDLEQLDVLHTIFLNLRSSAVQHVKLLRRVALARPPLPTKARQLVYGYTFRTYSSKRFPGVGVPVVPASPLVRRRMWEGRVKCGKDVSFRPNAARQLPELHRPSLEPTNLANTKTSWVSLAVSTVRLEVVGLVAQTRDNDVLYRFHIREEPRAPSVLHQCG